MDFGSASTSPIQPTSSRKQCLSIWDNASQNTTMSIRAPELFEDGVIKGDEIDMRKCDVWSFGCLLFASRFGLSPFESEFESSGKGVRVVDCGYLRVLNGMKPPRNVVGAVGERWGEWQSSGMGAICERCLADANVRPTIVDVLGELKGIEDTNHH